jgi:Zn-dependent metalloprotease
VSTLVELHEVVPEAVQPKSAAALLNRTVRRLIHTVLPTGLILTAGASPAQLERPSRQRIAVAASIPGSSTETARVDSLIADMIRTGELVLVTSQPDRQVPGRTLEYFGQVAAGMPVLGAGVARQLAGVATVSAYGTIFSGVDVDPVPGLDAEAALDRIQAIAGVGPATTEPPVLAVFPTPLGRLVLSWSAPMRDYRTWFIDAHSGELVHRQDHIRTEAAVGFGPGITGARQKLSVWKSGQGYEAWDRLRPAEIVTLDARSDFDTADALLEPSPAWEDAVAGDDDNEWSDPAVVDGHAHLGFTYDYLFSAQGWRGMDDADGRIFSIVNLGDLPNAFFVSPPFGPQGTGALGFGQTDDGTPFVPVDIVAHELMHGVTDSALVTRTGLPLIGRHEYLLGPSQIQVQVGASNDRGPLFEVFRCGDLYAFEDFSGPLDSDREDHLTAPLLCFDENGKPTRSRSGRFGLFMDHGGAIHEAYSDIVATGVEFMVHPPGDGLLRADYVQGEDIGFPFRRIDAPSSMSIGTFSFPDALTSGFRFVVAHLGDRQIRYTGLGMKDGRPFRLSGDGYSAVHWNSVILSHAFYLAIEGGTHASSGRTVRGAGDANRTEVEQAFFRALVDLAPPFADFQTMGVAIRQAAVDLHGDGSAVHAAIDQALAAVGL